jgi:DNA recombination protein RmuC
MITVPHVVPLALAGGVLAGLVLAWLALRGRSASLRTERDLTAERASRAEGRIAELEGERRRLESERAALRTELESERELMRRERETYADIQAGARETFEALAAKALRESNKSFLELAGQQLGTITAEASGDLEIRKQAVEALVKPLADTLRSYQEEIHKIELKRSEEQGGLRSELQSLVDLGRRLEKETGSLASALKAPQVRGRWGEFTLRRVAELAGMVSHCDFVEQASVATEDGRLRPDMIVKLPSDRTIVVDAKVVLHAYLDAQAAATQGERDRLLDLHAKHVRDRVKDLGSKAYWEQFGRSPEFCVLFLPGEAFYGAAVERDPALFEDAVAAKIFLATPGTLIALLHAVGFGWRQEKIAESATRISDAARVLYDRVVVWMEHLEKMGSALGKAVEQFNRGYGSLERRVIPAAKRMKELAEITAADPPEIEPIEIRPVIGARAEDPASLGDGASDGRLPLG